MSADRYPLTWPQGWKRTPAGARERAAFSKSMAATKTERVWQNGQWQDVTRKVRRALDLSSGDAAERLEYQLTALGASDGILSTNQRLRLDGRPRQNEGEPADPGAAIYFRFNKQDRVLACDKWDRVADNIAALAAHIDALRRIDRYGVGDLNQAFAGYAALPAKGSTWRTTLGFAPDETVTPEMISEARRRRAREAHPDVQGGSHDAMASLNVAVDEGLREISA